MNEESIQRYSPEKFCSFYRGNQRMHIFEKYMKLSRCNVESRFILFQL
jgi:hypothetical protein